ncbi:MAG TPA: YIP1 family protein [Candidatus Acidoferrum sp.]|nr:YIP1 family protein [Candidatus Acidoferrum sp.]
MATTTVPPQPAPASVSSFGRIFGALFNPKPTFESIAQRPSWILPLLLLLVMSVAVTAIFGQRVGWRGFMEKQIAHNASAQRRMEQMTPEQRQQIVDQQAKFAPVFGYVGAVVFTFGGAALVAAIFLVIFNMLGGAKIGFSTSLGIVAHSWMPYFVSGLLGILILFIKDPSTVDIQNLVASNPGALLSDDSPKWLVSLCTSLDIFTFWALILMAVGFNATNPKKIPFGKALGSILAIWIVWVLVKVGLAAAFS